MRLPRLAVRRLMLLAAVVAMILAPCVGVFRRYNPFAAGMAQHEARKL